MLLRALLLVCLLSQTARADSTTSAAAAATPSREATAAAVPVDKEALVAPADEEKLVIHREFEDDPLFVPAAVLIGGGAAALLASLFTGLGADSMYRSLERDCPKNTCTPDRQDRIDSGKSLAVVSTVFTGVGVVAAGVGTVLMIIAATRDGERVEQPGLGNFQLSLTGGPTPLGIGATARF